MDKQLTSLASEYGEYVANSLDYDMYPDPGLRYRLVAKGHSEAAQLCLNGSQPASALWRKIKSETLYVMQNYIVEVVVLIAKNLRK